MNQKQPSKLLDFSLIAGRWRGEATSASQHRFWIDVALSPAAERGSSLGPIKYGMAGEGKTACQGVWLAERADDPVYILSEQVADPCPNGTVRLERDPESGTLAYEFTPAEGEPSFKAAGSLSLSD